jgi:hypothetical protein
VGSQAVMRVCSGDGWSANIEVAEGTLVLRARSAVPKSGGGGKLILQAKNAMHMSGSWRQSRLCKTWLLPL